MSIRDLVPKIRRSRTPARQDETNRMVSFQKEMNRLFDEFFTSFDPFQEDRWLPTPLWGHGRKGALDFSPSVNVSETDKEVRVSAELPGMDEKDVTVELENDALVVRGEKKSEHEEKKGSWHRMESSYGSFHRVIPLPVRVDTGSAKARFKKGVLTVVLPKKEEDRKDRRTVTVETE